MADSLDCDVVERTESDAESLEMDISVSSDTSQSESDDTSDLEDTHGEYLGGEGYLFEPLMPESNDSPDTGLAEQDGEDVSIAIRLQNTDW